MLAPSLTPNTQSPSRVEAQVSSLTTVTTALGDRTYAVFNAIDGSTLGFWANANHPNLRALRVGDAVTLKRSPRGHLTLAPQPVGIFVRLQRPWRLL